MSPQDHAVEHLAPSGQCCCGAFGRRALAGSNQSLGATLKVIAEPDPNLELSLPGPPPQGQRGPATHSCLHRTAPHAFKAMADWTPKTALRKLTQH